MIYYDSMGHLISDTSLDELHRFARTLGLRREWFQDKGTGIHWHPHYDLTTNNAMDRAGTAGAKKISPKELVRLIRKAPYQIYKPDIIK
jgi:hypothetical protein